MFKREAAKPQLLVTRLQYKQSQSYYQSNKGDGEQREETEAIKSDLHIPKEQFPPSLLGLADFSLTFRANIPDLVAVTDGKIALHWRHSHLVIEFFMANRTRTLHNLNITKLMMGMPC